MNIKVDFDNIVVKEDKNDFNVKVLMLKGEKGDKGDGEANVIEKVQVNGTNLPVTNKTVNVPVPVVDSSISSSSTNPVQNNAIYNALSNKADTSALDNYYEISEVDSLLDGKADILLVNKKPYYFDTVADMLDYDLEEGSYVITKGYFGVNDGGGASYYITSTSSQTEYQEELDNGLYAKLIIEPGINAKQFGAKGDGINDDTAPIENMYDYISNKLNDDYFNKTLHARFTEGKYLVTSSLEIPVYIKTEIIGNVTIISDIDNDALIKIKSGIKNSSNIMAVQTQSFVDGNIISTNSGVLVLQRINNISDINGNNTSIGISIEATTGNAINISRCNFNNITIIGFNKALNINMINTYLLTFNHCRFEWNKYNVYFDGTNYVNSGENITFNNCIFSHSYNGINLNGSISGLNLNNCSFDFNGNHILINYVTNGLINCKGCHFEGVGFNSSSVDSDITNTSGFGYLVYRNVDSYYTLNNVSLDSCVIHLGSCNPSNHIFGTLNNTSAYNKSLKIKLNMCMLSYNDLILNFDNRYLADENTEIVGNSLNNFSGFIQYQYSSDDYYGKFKGIANNYTGDYKVDKTTLNNNQIFIGANDWTSSPVNISIDTTDKIFDKSLVVDQVATNSYCMFTRRIYPKTKKIQATFYAKDGGITASGDYILRIQPKYVCKDVNDTTLNVKQDQFIPNNSQQYTKDGWLCTSVEFNIPTNCEYADITANVVVRDNNNIPVSFTGPIKCGGIIVKEIDY